MSLPNTTSDAAELNWLAFCYAAGDLDGPQAEQFEAALATDQAAREALARAVELTQTVAAAQSVGWAVPATVSLPSRNTQKLAYRRVWIGLAIAGAVLLAFSQLIVTGPSTKKSHPLRAQLASAWSATRSQMTEASEPEIWSEFEAAYLDSEFPYEPLSVEADPSEAPSWMMAAVYARSAQAASSTESTERLEN